MYVVTEELAGLEVGQRVDIDRDAWRALIDGGVLRQATPDDNDSEPVVLKHGPNPAQLHALDDERPNGPHDPGQRAVG